MQSDFPYLVIGTLTRSDAAKPAGRELVTLADADAWPIMRCTIYTTLKVSLASTEHRYGHIGSQAHSSIAWIAQTPRAAILRGPLPGSGSCVCATASLMGGMYH